MHCCFYFDMETSWIGLGHLDFGIWMPLYGYISAPAAPSWKAIWKSVMGIPNSVYFLNRNFLLFLESVTWRFINFRKFVLILLHILLLLHALSPLLCLGLPFYTLYLLCFHVFLPFCLCYILNTFEQFIFQLTKNIFNSVNISWTMFNLQIKHRLSFLKFMYFR